MLDPNCTFCRYASRLISWVLSVTLGLILGVVLSVIIAITQDALAAQGDYCLGEWDHATEVHCKRVAVASTALAVDRKTGMSIQGAYGQVEGLKQAWGVSKRLLNATIHILWDEEHINPKTLNPLQFGAVMEGQCIDMYDEMIGWE